MKQIYYLIHKIHLQRTAYATVLKGHKAVIGRAYHTPLFMMIN